MKDLISKEEIEKVCAILDNPRSREFKKKMEVAYNKAVAAQSNVSKLQSISCECDFSLSDLNNMSNKGMLSLNKDINSFILKNSDLNNMHSLDFAYKKLSLKIDNETWVAHKAINMHYPGFEYHFNAIEKNSSDCLYDYAVFNALEGAGHRVVFTELSVCDETVGQIDITKVGKITGFTGDYYCICFAKELSAQQLMRKVHRIQQVLLFCYGSLSSRWLYIGNSNRPESIYFNHRSTMNTNMPFCVFGTPISFLAVSKDSPVDSFVRPMSHNFALTLQCLKQKYHEIVDELQNLAEKYHLEGVLNEDVEKMLRYTLSDNQLAHALTLLQESSDSVIRLQAGLVKIFAALEAFAEYVRQRSKDKKIAVFSKEDKENFRKLMNDFRKQISKYFTEDTEAYKHVNLRLDDIPKDTNTETLKKIFELYGIQIEEAIINYRNDYLHGRDKPSKPPKEESPDFSLDAYAPDEEQTFEKQDEYSFHIFCSMHRMLSVLFLKIVGFNGQVCFYDEIFKNPSSRKSLNSLLPYFKKI